MYTTHSAAANQMTAKKRLGYEAVNCVFALALHSISQWHIHTSETYRISFIHSNVCLGQFGHFIQSHRRVVVLHTQSSLHIEIYSNIIINNKSIGDVMGVDAQKHFMFHFSNERTKIKSPDQYMFVQFGKKWRAWSWTCNWRRLRHA